MLKILKLAQNIVGPDKAVEDFSYIIKYNCIEIRFASANVPSSRISVLRFLLEGAHLGYILKTKDL